MLTYLFYPLSKPVSPKEGVQIYKILPTYCIIGFYVNLSTMFLGMKWKHINANNGNTFPKWYI